MDGKKRGMMDCYLLVELVNIVSGLVLGLNEDWVLLYLIGGHIAGKMVVDDRRGAD